MAISDYIPNVFGAQNPMYEGLLGAQDATALSQRSNVAGLLGAAAALASGMSSQGARRSPLQNVLGALAAGYGTSGQAYQSGIEQMANAQKLAQARLESAKLIQANKAVDELVKNDPRIANDPLKVAYFRANPTEALKLYSEILPLEAAGQRIKGTEPTATGTAASALAVPSSQATQQGQEQPAGAPVTVTAPAGRGQQLVAQRDQLVNTINVYSSPEFIANKRAQDIVAAARESLKTINTELGRSAVEGYDWSAIESTVPPPFKQRVLNLKQLAEAGEITPKDLSERVDAIGKDAVEYVSKKQDYTNQDRRVAAGMFQGRPIESLNPVELMQLENKLYEMRIAEKKAGATVIDMGSREMEKEFAKGVVEDTRTSFNQAKSAVNSIKTINRLRPVIQAGVYEGALAGAPRAIDQLATALGVTGKDTQEKLQRTAVAMQALASLELTAAEAMKGQGAITENERTLIARAAGGNLRDFTSGEIQALLASLEKIAQQKIETHQMNFEVMSQDPVAKKYSKYYKIEAPQVPVRKYNPATGRIE